MFVKFHGTYEKNQLPHDVISAFKRHILEFYAIHQREFIWRSNPSPYWVFISEIMLQQTQTERVKDKFSSFIDLFPDFDVLAAASQATVVRAWQGLGYNRRAIAIHEAARRVVSEYQSVLPSSVEILETFPGIGKATASSMCAFAFNMPTIFIETNIRTVYIHTFFSERDNISDKELYPLIEQSLDLTQPRIWYYALMDYGVALKKHFKNPSRKSKHYNVQSRFQGSNRQIRGLMLKLLSQYGSMKHDELYDLITASPEKIDRIVTDLMNEKFIEEQSGCYRLKI